MNDFNIELTGSLNTTKSKNKLNQDINTIENSLKELKLKAKIDPNQIKSLEAQLNTLKISLSDISVSPSALTDMVNQINNALKGIQISNFNISSVGVGNTGRQIGEIISKEAEKAVGDVTSKVIGQGFNVSPQMSQKVQSELENIVKDWTNGKGKISSITIDTKTDFNEQTLENIEQLKSVTVQYSNELGQVITKTLKYKQIGVNTFANGETEAIKGWVESASTYKATLESTNKSTSNFVNQQKKAVTDLKNQVNQIYKGAIDPNASKPIKDSANLTQLEASYNNIVAAINKMGSASEATFADERNSVNTLISDLKIVIREYKNAETAATSMRSKDVGTVKAIKTNELDEFIAKIQNSKVPMKELKSEIASLKKSLSNVTDTDSLTAYLNEFDIVSSKFKSLKEQFSKGNSISSVVFNTSELEAQSKIYIQKVRNTIEAIKPALESKLRKAGYVDIEIKGVEKANGQIKSLIATATDATGVFKQLTFERQKIKGGGKAQDGFVQTDDVKIIGTLSSSIEKVQDNLNILKSKWEEQGILVGDFKTKVEELESSLATVGSKGELNNLKSQIRSLKDEASNISKVNKIQLSLDTESYSKDIAKINADLAKIGKYTLSDKSNLEAFEKTQISVKSLLSTYETLQNVMKDTNATNQQKIAAEEAYQKTLTTTKNLLSQIKVTADDEILTVGSSERTNMIATLNNYIVKNTAMGKANENQIKSWIATIESSTDITKGDLKQINTEFKKLDSTLRQTGRLGLSVWDKFKESVKKFGGWSLVTGSIMRMVSKVRSAISEIKNLDSILTEVSKTSDLTEKQLKKLGESSFESASEFGKKASDYLNNVAEMYRAGFDNAEEMARLSLLAQAAGDLDSSASDDYLLATNAAYDYKGSVEALNEVLDSQNYITNNAAVNMKDMSDATSEAASVASAYGVKIEELSALIAVAVSKTRESGSEVGNALKSIFINLQDTTNNSIVEAFDAVGISMTKIVDGSELLKTPIELIKELSEVFNSLPEGDTRKANILSDIAGKYHANTFSSILSDLDSYYKMLELYNSTEAEGSALVEAEKSANNLEGSLNKLSNTWTETVNNIADSDDLTFIVNMLNSLLKILETITDKAGLLGTIGIGAGLFAGFKNVGISMLVAC